MIEVEVESLGAVWGTLGETEAERLDEVVRAVRECPDGQVIEVNEMDVEVIPDLFALIQRKFEGSKEAIVGSYGGCDCGKLGCPDNGPAQYTVTIANDRDLAVAVLENRARERSMFGAHNLPAGLSQALSGMPEKLKSILGEKIAEHIKSLAEKGEIGPGAEGAVVSVAEYDLESGEMRIIKGDPDDLPEGVATMIEQLGGATPKKRTVH